MKNEFLKFVLVAIFFKSFAASAQTPSRASLCPQGAIPLLDDVSMYEGKYKGLSNQWIKIGETKTFCIPLKSNHSFLFFAGMDKLGNNYERTISAELSLNGQPVKAYDVGSGFRDILADPAAGVYLVKVKGVLTPQGSCNSKPSLCREAIEFELMWRTMDVDKNIKVACPRDVVEITQLHVSGWRTQKIGITGGNTYRFCARMTNPSYGFQADWDSRTQGSCDIKDVRVTPLTYPSVGQRTAKAAESGGVDYARPMKPQAMLIDVIVDPSRKGCSESGEVSWIDR